MSLTAWCRCFGICLYALWTFCTFSLSSVLSCVFHTGFRHLPARFTQVILPCSSGLSAGLLPQSAVSCCSLHYQHNLLFPQFRPVWWHWVTHPGPAIFTICTFIICSVLHPLRSVALSDRIKLTNTFAELHHHTTPSIRYDTRCYFNVRSKVDMSRLNLPHGNDNWKL